MATKPATRKPTKPKPNAKPKAKAKAKPAAKPAKAKATPGFQTLLDVFLERPGVTEARMMGCRGLRIANKYFAMEWDGLLVVKLPRDTVDSYATAGKGARFDPGMGRPMKEWLTVRPGAADWRHLAEQAFTFVAASL